MRFQKGNGQKILFGAGDTEVLEGADMTERVKGSWFKGLKWWQKILAIYFVVSFGLACCYVGGPWWASLLVVANFSASAFLLRYVPIAENE